MKALLARLNPNKVPNLSPIAWLVMGLVLAVLILADFFVHHHSHFGFEDSFGFYAWYGFAASAGLVLAGKLLGKLLKRPEDYYGDDAQQNETDHD